MTRDSRHEMLHQSTMISNSVGEQDNKSYNGETKHRTKSSIFIIASSLAGSLVFTIYFTHESIPRIVSRSQTFSWLLSRLSFLHPVIW